MADDLAELQIIEQNLQQFLMQKQQLQAQLIEIDSALKELVGKEKAYKIISNIMVLKDSSELNDDLKSKKEIIELRLKSIEKQEKMMKDKATKIQTSVMDSMKKEKNA